MTTTTETKPLRVRRVNGEIQLRRYGKWYDTNSLRSLAAYKFITYDNAESLQPHVDYEKYDVYHYNPLFRFYPKTFGRNGGRRWKRPVVAPTGLWHYLVEEIMETDHETVHKLFKLHDFSSNSNKSQYGDFDCDPYLKCVVRNDKIPFTVCPKWNYIEFALKDSVWLKWDSEVDEVVTSLLDKFNENDPNGVDYQEIVDDMMITPEF